MPINNVSPQTSTANIWTALQTLSAGLTISAGQVVRMGNGGNIVFGVAGSGIYIDLADAGPNNPIKFGGVPSIWTNNSNALTLAPRVNGSGFVLQEAASVALFVDAANTLAIRNGANAQTLNLYKTFTDASNYERLSLWADTVNNVFRIDSQAAGTGVSRNTAFMSGNVGIGTTNPLTTAHINGGLAVGVVTKTAAYTATASDYVILADATTAAFTVTLPAATQKGQIIVVIKIDSGVNAITVSRAGADTIEGATTKTLSTQNAKTQLLADGVSRWYDLVAGLV